jgi:hypothetical protein
MATPDLRIYIAYRELCRYFNSDSILLPATNLHVVERSWEVIAA